MNSLTKIIEVVGILDSVQGIQVRDQVTDAVQKGSQVVLVDLAKVSFMDSSGLGALVAALKTARSAGSELYLCSVTDQVQMLFELTSMNQVFKILPSQSDFLETVGA